MWIMTGKIGTKIVVARFSWLNKCKKMRNLRTGVRPGPHWGSSQRSPYPLARFGGRIAAGDEKGRGEKGKGSERTGRERRGRKWTGRKRREREGSRGDGRRGEGPLDCVFPVAFITPVCPCEHL